MSQFEDVEYTVEGMTAVITINRQQRYNAFRARTVDELIKAFRLAWADRKVQAVILTGAGEKAFCTGGDVKQRAETGDYGPSESGMFEIGNLHKLIRDIPKPVIAAVNGIAVGGGTTGEPKGAMHTHNTLVAALRPLPERLASTDRTVVHMASTLAHLTGLLYGARLPLTLGATAVLQDLWNAEVFLELVERHGVTYTAGATPYLHDVVSAVAQTKRDLGSLGLFCCMGAPIPRVLVTEARELLPNLVVLGGWGQTENALVTLGIPGDPLDKITKTDGYPWQGMHIRVVDVNGVPLDSGQEGRLHVRGPSLFLGDAKRLEPTREQFHDGWFDTGDLARIDSDGYVSLSGRTKDIIIRGGENIPVVYVENTLYENPKLASVAVVGIPDPRVQERACACVTLASGVTEFTFEEMQGFLREKGMAKQYWPERLEVLDALPSTPSGKIQKFALRAIVRGQQ